MSVRNTSAHGLAKRARDVGWKVGNPRGIAGAYKITMPVGKCKRDGCNHILQIHLSSSDVNAERVILRDMNMHGLAEAERKAAKVRETERLKTIEAGKVAAERKAAELVKNARAVNRAAGPYAGPELVDISWFLAKHPAPTFKWVIMTPELAQQILDKSNTNNRPLVDEDADHLSGIILSDQWRLTHQGGAHDEDGVLQDGQHRLKGIIKSGIAVPMPWFCGMSRENFKAIDENKARTAAQLFARDGESYGLVAQGLVKLVLALSTDAPKRAWRRKLTNEQIYDAFNAEEKEELRIAAAFAGRHAKKALAGPTGLAGAYYMIRKANGPDNPYVEAFFNGYIYGRKDSDLALHPDDPRLRLREYTNNLRVTKKRLPVIGAYGVTVRAWNYVISGKKVSNMRWADNSEVPRVDTIKVDPRGVVYGCPELLRGEVVDTTKIDFQAAA